MPTLFWVAVGALVAAMLLALVRPRRHRSAPSLGDRSEDLLRERYARGELSAKQYRQARQVLREGAHT